MRPVVLALLLATVVACGGEESAGSRGPTSTGVTTVSMPTPDTEIPDTEIPDSEIPSTEIPDDTTPPRVAVTAAPVESLPVAPPDDSMLALVRRDCGMSVPLPAGGALWLYCDTAVFREDDRPAWFSNSSAAFASDAEPRTMHEPTDVRGRVRPFVSPNADYPSCDPGAGRFTWPTAAVPVGPEQDATIAVFYENVCIESPIMQGADIGVAEFVPPDDPVPAGGFERGAPAGWIQAEVVEDRLFGRDETTHAFGQAALRSGEHVYAYQCPPGDDPCRVARAAASMPAIADPTAWQAWDGVGWSSGGRAGDLDDAAPMAMPDAVRLVKPSVGWLDDMGVYALAGHRHDDTGVVQLRVAREPWGPWSAASEITLPGCQASFPNICFGVEIHSQLSDADHIGLTWYDPAFPVGEGVPTRFASIPLELS